LKSFLIGSDGVCDLMELGGQNISVGRDVVGELDSFWNTDGYYENPYMLPNRLRLINTDQIKIDWEARKKVSELGKLSDDTTLVVGSWSKR
jgi:hypothetical protein